MSNVRHDLAKMEMIASGEYAEGRRRTLELDIAALRQDINIQGDPAQMARSDDSLLSQMHFTRLRFAQYFTHEQVKESQDWYLARPPYIGTLLNVVRAYGSSGAIDQVFALAVQIDA